MKDTVFTPYEEDIICIYRGNLQPCNTRAAIIDRINTNLPYIDDENIKNDVLTVLRKLIAMSDTSFQELMKELIK